MLMVYRFKYFDRDRKAFVMAGHLATDKAIREFGGLPIPGSALVVEASRVGRSGVVVQAAEPPQDP
jgi:hypothetical protein